jgi:hypothetical protein
MEVIMNTKHLVATLALTFVAGAHAATPVMPSEPSTDAAVAAASAPQFDAATFDQHTKRMRDIHEQMMAASTPEERAALMHEGRTSMQHGMAMMKQMRMGMVSGMPMENHMGGMGMAQGMPMDCTGEDRRMEMMDAMMQLMIDQQAPAQQ